MFRREAVFGVTTVLLLFGCGNGGDKTPTRPTPPPPTPAAVVEVTGSGTVTIHLCLLFIHPGAPNLISPPVCRHHTCLISSFVRALISAFKAHRELALDNVALRQQFAVLCCPGETAAALEGRPRVG